MNSYLYFPFIVILVAGREFRCPEKCECLDAEFTCLGRSLTSVPSPLPGHLRILNIRSASLNRRLRNDSFAGVGELRTLRLERCRLRHLPGHLLQPVPLLRELSLAANRLEELPDDLLTPCGGLRLLDISDNELQSLPATVLRSMRSLEVLRAAGNPLSTPASMPVGVSRAPALRVLDLSRNQRFTALPARWFYGADADAETGVAASIPMTLNFSWCQLDTVSESAFLGLKVGGLVLSGNARLDVNAVLRNMDTSVLRVLHIASLGIADIFPLFRESSHLKLIVDLDLSYNTITYAAVNTLNNLKRLETLRLDHNKLSSIDKLGSLENLKSLDLGHNLLTELPRSSLEAYSSLRSLVLAGNRFRQLSSETFGSNFGLRSLDLSACRLDSLEFAGGGGESLLELDASENRLQRFDWLARLANLRRLRLSSNHIVALAPDLRHPRLVELDLSRNRVRECPEPFACLDGLSGLQSLNLSANRLTSLDGRLALPASLEIADFTANRLSVVSEVAFAGASSLDDLRLTGNSLNDGLNPAAFAPLSGHLTRLDLTGNKAYGPYFRRDIATISGHLRELRTLNIRDISLTDLKDDSFDKLLELEHLDLGSNRLTSFNSRLTRSLRKLKTVSLAGNSDIVSLDPSAFSGVADSVDLTGMVLRCDCSAAPLQRWLRTTRTRVKGNPMCRGHDGKGQSVLEAALGSSTACLATSRGNEAANGEGGDDRDSKLVVAVAVAVAASLVMCVACGVACVVCRWRMRGHRKFPPTSPSRRHVYADCKSSDTHAHVARHAHNARHAHDERHAHGYEDGSCRRSDADDSTRTIRTNDSACSHSPEEACPLKKAWV